MHISFGRSNVCASMHGKIVTRARLPVREADKFLARDHVRYSLAESRYLARSLAARFLFNGQMNRGNTHAFIAKYFVRDSSFAKRRNFSGGSMPSFDRISMLICISHLLARNLISQAYKYLESDPAVPAFPPFILCEEDEDAAASMLLRNAKRFRAPHFWRETAAVRPPSVSFGEREEGTPRPRDSKALAVRTLTICKSPFMCSRKRQLKIIYI